MNETSNANLTQLHKECRKRKANPHEQIPQHGVIVEKKIIKERQLEKIVKTHQSPKATQMEVASRTRPSFP